MKEVMVIIGVGIEIRPPGFHYDFPHQTRLGKLVQGVINCRQRYANAGCARLFMQIFRRYVAILVFKQQLGQRNTLSRRTQPSLF